MRTAFILLCVAVMWGSYGPGPRAWYFYLPAVLALIALLIVAVGGVGAGFHFG